MKREWVRLTVDEVLEKKRSVYFQTVIQTIQKKPQAARSLSDTKQASCTGGQYPAV